MVPKIITSLVTGSIMLSASLQAAPYVPDAGSLQQQQRPAAVSKQKKQMVQDNKGKSEPSKPFVIKPSANAKVPVKRFTFSGYEGTVSRSELQDMVKPYVGKNLSMEQLHAVSANITSELRAKGWLASATLPPQDVTAGTVHITINSGKTAMTSITGDESVRICERPLRQIAEKTCPSGSPLNTDDQERAVLLMNDIPGIAATTSLSKGMLAGTTDVNYLIREGALLSGVLWGDNYGNRYTGTWTQNAVLNINDPIHYGEQFSLNVGHSAGMWRGGVNYRVPMPFLFAGLTGHTGVSGMQYELLEDFEVLDYEGSSINVDAGLSYALLRSRKANLTSDVSYTYKGLKDSMGNTDLRDGTIQSVTFGLSGNYRDDLFFGALTTADLSITNGSLEEKIRDISLSNSEGGYTRLNMGLARYQRFSEPFVLDLAFSAQRALNNLDSSEKFFLGGPQRVRAYPLGEAAGDHGALFKADFRHRISVPEEWGDMFVNAFYDAGHVTLNKDRYASDSATITATGRNDYWLQGAGLGLRYDISENFTLQGCWAHTIGKNSGRSVDGNNSDGKSDNNRFWVQGLYYF
uniref:Probable activation/secretion signal peptide protein n=1 Tax=Chlorobium chlorochromatii (strain CaD3) TaxID=340177 RepID=Q3ARQ9_CHLCH